MKITLKVASEDLIAFLNVFSCFEPSIVRFGSLIAARHSGGTGLASGGATAEKTLRVLCGAVGARSGSPLPAGLSQAPPKSALELRNERSSRKKTSRFLPQRCER